MSTVDVLALDDADAKHALGRLPLQETSLDIWDKKYRLKTKDGDSVDHTINDTFERVARALAEVERSDSERKHWYCLLYTSPSPRDKRQSRMPSSA